MEEKCPRCGAFLENGVCPYCGYAAPVPAGNNNNKGGSDMEPLRLPDQDGGQWAQSSSQQNSDQWAQGGGQQDNSQWAQGAPAAPQQAAQQAGSQWAQGGGQQANNQWAQGAPAAPQQAAQQTGSQWAQAAPAAAAKTVYVVSVSPKSKITALLLCFFVGIFGVHRFYVGKILSGLVYLFTGGILGIGVLYDLIMILTGSFTDGNGLPLKD